MDATSVKAKIVGNSRKREGTRDRILAGTLTALGARGVRKATIEDICLASNVSRRTLYRYFESREEIIANLGEHIRVLLETALKRSIVVRPNLDERVRIVLDELIYFSTTYERTSLLVSSEIGFVIGGVTQNFPEYVEMVRETVEPIFDAIPELGRAGLMARDLADLIVRFAAQTLVFPAITHDQAVETFCRHWKLVVLGARASSGAA